MALRPNLLARQKISDFVAGRHRIVIISRVTGPCVAVSLDETGAGAAVDRWAGGEARPAATGTSDRPGRKAQPTKPSKPKQRHISAATFSSSPHTHERPRNKVVCYSPVRLVFLEYGDWNVNDVMEKLQEK